MKRMSETTVKSSSSLTSVTKQVFHLPELLLQNGHVLRDVQIGFETYGKLSAAKDNVILIAHYYSGTSHAAGRYSASDTEAGYWDSIVGPGKPIDTDRFFVISCDCLCNLNTKSLAVITTGPCSINPETGRRYGKDFPVVTIGDFVNSQKAILDSLEIKELYAVAGPSMGALQTLEWSARYPEMVSRVISVIPAGLKAPSYLLATLDIWTAPIYLDPNFNDGDYYDGPEPIDGLTQAFKLVTYTALHPTGVGRLYGTHWSDPKKDPAASLKNSFSVSSSLQDLARTRALACDANSFLRLARAVQLFSIEERKKNIRAKFLFIPAETDLLMFPFYSEEGVNELRELGLDVQTIPLDGDGGHLDGIYRIAQAGSAIRSFLNETP